MIFYIDVRVFRNFLLIAKIWCRDQKSDLFNKVNPGSTNSPNSLSIQNREILKVVSKSSVVRYYTRLLPGITRSLVRHRFINTLCPPIKIEKEKKWRKNVVRRDFILPSVATFKAGILIKNHKNRTEEAMNRGFLFLFHFRKKKNKKERKWVGWAIANETLYWDCIKSNRLNSNKNTRENLIPTSKRIFLISRHCYPC